MPFDPTLPADHSPNSSAEMRGQLTALKALIEAVAVPGPAFIGGASLGSGGSVELSGLTADGATSFDIFLQEPDAPGFITVAMAVPGNAYEFDGLPPGSYAARVAGRNAAGAGPWSEASPFTIS